MSWLNPVSSYITARSRKLEEKLKVSAEYHTRKKQEKKSGGSGWESQRWKQDLLERASIAIAKGNHNMLRNNRTLPAC